MTEAHTNIVIQRYEEFDADIANATIGAALPAPVTDVEIKPMGEGVGLMSSITRAVLTLASGETRTVVVKCIARTDNSELSKGLNFYRNEVNFYRSLAAECPVRVPASLYAAIDEATQDFLLVLEDIEQESADQIAGCSEAELHIAFERAGELHGVFHGRTSEFDWLNYQVDMKTILFRRDAILRPGIQGTLERFPEYFHGDLADSMQRIGERYIDLFLAAMRGEPTIVHGDYRLDNMFVVDNNGKPDVIAFDWQNTMGGNGTHDVAYFAAGCCGPELRGEPEMAALRHYHDVLCERGVKHVSFDECLEAYRYNVVITMITPLAICGTLDTGNERGVKLGTTNLERALAAFQSLECGELVR